jgi:hypothetical protein
LVAVGGDQDVVAVGDELVGDELAGGVVCFDDEDLVRTHRDSLLVG